MPSSADTYTVPRKPDFRKVSEWTETLQDPSERVILQRLGDIYGHDRGLIDSRRAMFLRALKRFEKLYGPRREVVITRSPCRINLRGMHSEMQHATPNYLTHGREVIMVAGERDDDLVVLSNIDSERFGTRQFRISEEMARGKWGNWVEYIDSPGVRESVESARGDWANYVKASVLKLQDSFPESRLKGMDVVAFGDAPRGCGMASSSTVVVSSALAAMATNDLTMDRRELTVCLGRGEWYVGTRGGFGDHGAMLFGRQGHIVHSVFLTVEEMRPEYIPLPQDHQVIIINSYKTSAKSAERLFAYNQTMFAYSMALTLIKDVLADTGRRGESCIRPEFLDQLNYLGQITPETSGLQRIYEILRALPERITVAELKKRYSTSEIDGRLDRFFGQLGRFPDSVEVRGAALWGIAESERSRAFARLIKEGRIKEAGELMYIGHDGDRLFAFTEGDAGRTQGSTLQPIEFTKNKVTDGYLDALMADLQSGEPDRVANAQLAKQPGDFDASSLELDIIVEIARRTPGIVGASLTGAGFGGNILAVGKKSEELLTTLKEALFEGYYEPQEQAELEWIRKDRDLEAAFGDDDELRQIRHKFEDIVKRKQKAKTRMSEDDIRHTESVQRKINALFRQGKIGRELLFIPADYYAEGIVVNIPVERAGIL
jgi:N-acetylgalactosamine kinase